MPHVLACFDCSVMPHRAILWALWTWVKMQLEMSFLPPVSYWSLEKLDHNLLWATRLLLFDKVQQLSDQYSSWLFLGSEVSGLNWEWEMSTAHPWDPALATVSLSGKMERKMLCSISCNTGSRMYHRGIFGVLRYVWIFLTNVKNLSVLLITTWQSACMVT